MVPPVAVNCPLSFPLRGYHTSGQNATKKTSGCYPITRHRITLTDPRMATMPGIMRMFLPIVHDYPPAVAEEVVAINVGGAVVPILFSLYLLFRSTTVILDAVIAPLLASLTIR